MDKKGQVTIASIVALTIGALFVAYFFIPQSMISTQPVADTDILSYTRSNTSNTSFNLQYGRDVINSSIIISGLTYGVNYTQSATYPASVTILANTTTTGNYVVSYSLYDGRYITSTSDRVIFGTLITIVIAGLLIYGARLFGIL